MNPRLASFFDATLEVLAPACFVVGLIACAGALLYTVGIVVTFIIWSS